MISGLERVLSHRQWFVPDVVIWGQPSLDDVDCLFLEQVGSDKSVLFGSLSVGGGSQVISFADLVDHRGNNLPDSINSPRVFIRPHSPETTFIVGTESNSSFKIARDPDSNGQVTADLFIIELDN